MVTSNDNKQLNENILLSSQILIQRKGEFVYYASKLIFN